MVAAFQMTMPITNIKQLMKTLHFLSFLLWTGVLAMSAEMDQNVPLDLKSIVAAMPDKNRAADLTKALNIVAASRKIWTQDRQMAAKQLLESGNNGLALFAIDEWGWWLSCFDDKKDWKVGDVTFLTNAMIKMSLPDDPFPGGEELAVRRGTVQQLSILLSRALKQPAPENSLLLRAAKVSDVKVWLRQTLNDKLKDADLTTVTRGVIQDSLAAIEKQKPLLAP